MTFLTYSSIPIALKRKREGRVQFFFGDKLFLFLLKIIYFFL